MEDYNGERESAEGNDIVVDHGRQLHVSTSDFNFDLIGDLTQNIFHVPSFTNNLEKRAKANLCY